MINIIVACDQNKLIGKNGKLPWKIEKDWNYFLNTTENGVLIMGRKCYEDFKYYANSRDVIVLSNSYHGEFENAKRCGSLLEAIEIAKCSGKEIWICGGRKVYEEAITFADRLYITLIESVFEGDVFFPDWEDFFNQKISSITTHEGDIGLKFMVYGRQ